MTIPRIEASRRLERIVRRAARAGLEVDQPLLQALTAYVGLLLRWNRRINLTALTDDDRGIDRLIIEPLVAAQRLPAPGPSITDIGSGGGSPAVPMKLAAPAARLRMVESRTRKVAFLREVVRQLDLGGTVVEACRYEELTARGTVFEGADVVTARAVRMESRTLKRILPLVKPGGAVFLFRTRADIDAEIPPPLRMEATCPLLDSSDSRLVILRRPTEGDAAD